MDQTRATGQRQDDPELAALPGGELPTMKLRPSQVAAAACALDPESQAPITERPSPGTTNALVLPLATRPDRGTLLTLAGVGAGATYAIEQDTTLIGRGAEATLVLDEPSVSRLHARITRDAEGSHWIEDLDSTNGTFVSGRRVKRVLLGSGDRVQLGRECVFRFAVLDEAEEALQRQLYEASLRDTLTALANRRCLFERLRSEIGHARRERRRLSFLMLDIDHFKSVNDRFGHLAGDQVLRAIALAGSRTLRGGDLLARYGGEELAVIARDAGTKAATTLAERLRAAIAAMRVEVGGGAVGVTVSIGVAELSECEHSDEGVELFARADARLYVAKRSGRNCVVAATPDGESLPSTSELR